MDRIYHSEKAKSKKGNGSMVVQKLDEFEGAFVLEEGAVRAKPS